ncbi:hypothetical protein NJ76_27425 [Rhodococcus sp. IITR03]|nr:hypothetical protein NJ76_27425 [Rhodococcus sp. IITR03]
MDHPGHQHRTRTAERMTERDRPSERIQLLRIRARLGEPRQRHRRECLVDLEDTDFSQCDAGLRQGLSVAGMGRSA